MVGASDRTFTAPLIALACLGVVFVTYVTDMFVPNTPGGHAIEAAVFWIALYPVGRLLWFATVPIWRWWAALATNILAVWFLTTWSRALAEETNQQLGLITFGFTVAVTVYWLSTIWARRRNAVTTIDHVSNR